MCDFQEQNCELKKTAEQNQLLLKKSSLNIPLLPEREDDRKMASLLSMKLVSSKSLGENTEIIRKSILSESSLPTSGFSRTKEVKAIKLLSKEKPRVNVIVKKREKDTLEKIINVENAPKKLKLTSSLVGDYGSSSGSEWSIYVAVKLVYGL